MIGSIGITISTLVAISMVYVAIDNLGEAVSPPEVTLDFGPKEIQENNTLFISQFNVWSPPQDTFWRPFSS